jgi:hypothetical protein
MFSSLAAVYFPDAFFTVFRTSLTLSVGHTLKPNLVVCITVQIHKYDFLNCVFQKVEGTHHIEERLKKSCRYERDEGVCVKKLGIQLIILGEKNE